MKRAIATFIIISIAIVWAYFLIASFLFPETTAPLNFADYFTNYILPTILIANAVFVVPIVVRIKLDEGNRRTLLKTKAILALTLVVLGNFLVHVAVFLDWGSTWLDGWIIVGVWLGNVIIFISLVAAAILASISIGVYRFITKRYDFTSNYWLSSIMDDFIFPIFSMITIIYSFYLISVVLQAVFIL